MNIQLRKFLHSQIFRSIKPQHFTPKSKFSSLSDNTVDNLNIPNEVLALINSARPIEPALTELSPLLNREVVISVLQSHDQLKMDPLICFRFFIWASEEARLRSRLSNKLMVDVLSSSGDVSSLDLCWSILDELRNEEKNISADVFAVLILGYWRLKKAEKAVETFGWTPQSFTSSRKSRAEVKKQSIFSFLDEDEKSELEGRSLGPSMQFDTFGFTAAELARKEADKEQQQRPSAIPGPVPDELIVPATESIGVKLANC